MNVRREANIRAIYPTEPSDAALSSAPLSNEARSARSMIGPSIIFGVLQAADSVGILLAGVAAMFWMLPPSSVSLLTFVLLCLAAIVTMNLLYFAGAYRPEKASSLLGMITLSLLCWGVVMAATVALVLAGPPAEVSRRGGIELWAVFGAGILVLNRILFLRLLKKWQRAGRFRRNAAILGAGPLGQRLIQKLTSSKDPEIAIVGVYDDRIARLPKYCLGYPIRGNCDALLQEVRAERVDCVFVAMPLSADWRLTEIMNKLSLAPVDVKLCTDNFGFLAAPCEVSHIGGVTTLDVCSKPSTGWRHVGKLIEDKLLAALILVAVSPLMAVVALLIKLDSAGPVLFRQKRLGFNNELIEVLKFRTLYHEARDQNAERLCTEHDPRVTRVGAFLRKSMIDELPQFINVLRGEMSIVGPRPHALAAKAGGLLYREAVKYYDARHRMKPGITGWAQVNGWRGETRTVEEIHQRVAHDLYYIHNWTIRLDLKIIVWTVLGAFSGVFRNKPRNSKAHAVSLANIGRSRSAA